MHWTVNKQLKHWSDRQIKNKSQWMKQLFEKYTFQYPIVYLAFFERMREYCIINNQTKAHYIIFEWKKLFWNMEHYFIVMFASWLYAFLNIKWKHIYESHLMGIWIFLIEDQNIGFFGLWHIVLLIGNSILTI